MDYIAAQKTVVQECDDVLSQLSPQQTDALLSALENADKIFFVAVGRVFLSLQSICKRFSHLGFNTHCVGAINEPAFTQNDLLIAASGSGESLLPVSIAKKAKSLGGKVAYLGGTANSTIARLADYQVLFPTHSKTAANKISSAQPMTSLFEQSLLLYGDTLAMMYAKKNNIDLSELWQKHANLE